MDYFEWLNSIIKDDEHTKLNHMLFETPFTYSIERDKNRYDEGLYLRTIYLGKKKNASVTNHLNGRCSVFEMMIALAIHESQIMADGTDEDSPGFWYHNMLDSMELTNITDVIFDDFESEVECSIKTLLNRTYSYDGTGGLFRIPNVHTDMRKVEIWYQMNWYLNYIQQ